MERDSDGVSLEFAPRFREDLCLCQCLLIHHTSCGPGSDTLQRLPNPLTNSCSALSCMCAHCSWPSLIPVFTLFLSPSECQGYQHCLGQDGQTLFYSVFIHAPHLDLFFLSTLRGFSPSLFMFCLPVSPAASLHIFSVLALNSRYKSRISHNEYLGYLPFLWSMCMYLFDRMCTSSHLSASFRNEGRLLYLINLANPPDGSAHTA